MIHHFCDSFLELYVEILPIVICEISILKYEKIIESQKSSNKSGFFTVVRKSSVKSTPLCEWLSGHKIIGKMFHGRLLQLVYVPQSSSISTDE